MISFKEFLKEAVLTSWTTDNKSIEEIVNLLNKHCKDGLKAISNGSILYRGAVGGIPNQIIDTGDSKRTSRDTNNLYQLMMDASTNLKNFPSRSNSLICATRKAASAEHGRVSIVIPFDGTTIAYSKKHADMFFTSLNNEIYSGGLESLGISIENALHELEIKGERFSDDLQRPELKFTSISDLDEALIGVSPTILAQHLSDNELTHGGCLKVLSRCPDDKKFTALSSAIMTPQNLDISKAKFGEVLPTNGTGNLTVKGNEAWFSGKALIITEKTFASIIKELQKLKYPIHKNVLEDMED